MSKLDLKKTLSSFSVPSKGAFAAIEVPPLSYVMVTGAGNPNTSPAYQDAVQALYATSYAMKFAAKETLGQDYVVPPLEGLWWADDPAAFSARDKDKWHWTMMIMVPDVVTREMYQSACEKARGKLGTLPDSLRLETLTEGLVLQTLHVGPYDDEGPILAKLHDEEMPARGLTFNGPHHEIYLSDPRRSAPEKLRTILRQPVRAMAPGDRTAQLDRVE